MTEPCWVPLCATELFSGVVLFILASLLSSCATSKILRPITETPVEPVSVSQVQQQPERFFGRRVRWGGSILAVRNRAAATEIEILARPLQGNGAPRGTARGEGRFIALVAGFADPAEYPQKRLLTVTGRVRRVETRSVGEYPYRYPLVAVEQRHLWPEPPPQPPPYYYRDPWYDPYPWYRPRHLWYPYW